ncbi:hypothetical protein [Fontivita pretiosa]|uniref:hypothetical protein n=1 Tax=Fontivita pretiosa TaxID=2989684 RepID=UPI003D174C31
MSEDRSNRIEWSGWAAVFVTALFGLIAVTIQWGVVTTKLDNLEKRLDEMIFESRSLRAEYQAVERRLALLEGQRLSTSAKEK